MILFIVSLLNYNMVHTIFRTAWLYIMTDLLHSKPFS